MSQRSEVLVAGADSIPVHRLKPEILYQIFVILKDIWSIQRASFFWFPNLETWNWVRVTQVCRYWRDTAFNYPSLWSEVINFQNIPKTKVFLERSKDAHLKIHFNISNVNGEIVGGDQKLDSLLEALKHADRVRDLDLDILIQSHQMDKLRKLQESLSRSFPQLQNAKVCIQGVRGAQLDLAVPLRFQDGTPSLRCLTLSRFSWPSNMVLPSGLSELSLASIKNFKIRDFLTILVSSPDLTKLTISNIQWNAQSRSELTSLENGVVSLPNLTSLSIAFEEGNEKINKELSKLVLIPEKASWGFTYKINNWQSTINTDFFIALVKESVQCIKLKIILMPQGFTIECQNSVDNNESSSSIYYIGEGIAFPALIIRAVASVINACRWGSVSVELTVGGIMHTLAAEHWTPLLLAFSAVQDLTVITIEYHLSMSLPGGFRPLADTKTNTEILLETLSYGANTSAPGGIFCRDLKSLSVEIGGDVPKDFVSILRKGLQKRKDVGLGLDNLLIHTTEPHVENPETLSDLAGNFTYTHRFTITD